MGDDLVKRLRRIEAECNRWYERYEAQKDEIERLKSENKDLVNRLADFTDGDYT